MEALGNYILSSTEWLYVKVCETPLFFIDYWSFVHFWSGLVIFSLLLGRIKQRRYLVCATILLLYECIEIAFIYGAFHVFRPETLKDQGTDIAVGLAGAWCARWWATSRSQGILAGSRSDITAGFVSVTIAFVWVGFYGYRYNTEMLNSAGINWWAFTLWSAAHFAVIRTFLKVNTGPTGGVSATLRVWSSYLTGLFLIEFAGFHLLHIREIGRPVRAALFGDILHGTPVTFLYYTSAPLITILIFNRFERLFDNAAKSVGRASSHRRRPECVSSESTHRKGIERFAPVE